MFNKKAFLKIFKRLKSQAIDHPFTRGVLSILVLLLLGVVFYNLLFAGRVFPGIHVADVNLSGKTLKEAEKTLEENINPPEKIVVKGKNQTFNIELNTVDFSYDFEESSFSAYMLTRTGNLLFDMVKRLTLPLSRKNIGLRLEFDEEKLEKTLSVIAGQVAIEPVYPSISFNKGLVSVEKGKPGQDIDKKNLRIKIGQTLSLAKNDPVEIKFIKTDPSLTDNEIKIAQKRAENLVGKKMILSFEYQEFVLAENDIFELIDPGEEYLADQIEKLAKEITDKVGREPQNPTFVFESGSVKEFAPAKDGIAVKKDVLKDMIIGNLRTLEVSEEKVASIDIPVKTTSPELKTEDVNNLGIKELIGRGSSTFMGSISSRIHNIGVSSSRFNGVLVAPGEVFSFNNILGDVSVYTGYKQAYIIKDGKTVLGDGGGVCQVSTTLFRAILDVGLPIIERRAHAYRVGYYEQGSPPGFDATIYSPITDLKFKNDTAGHLLIQTKFNPKTYSLIFEIYGTDDGRVVKTTKPVISNVTSPPEDKYVDDPSLPKGTTKQIDYKAWGANVYFTYIVKRGTETIYKKTFYSNYRPWQAVYLRGTGPAN